MTATLDDALALVTHKFARITDKAGQPYVLHCVRVMQGVSDPAAKIVALMHDLVEDTDVTFETLRQLGFSDEIITAVELVTHEASDSYAEYVIKLKSNEIARQVKLSDLRDNYSIDRVAYRESHRDKDIARIQRYILSFQFLTDVIDETTYRRMMKGLE